MAVPAKVKVNGQALTDFGLADENSAISGIGLVTYGFLWLCNDIWASCDDPDRTTTWTACSNVTESSCE